MESIFKKIFVRAQALTWRESLIALSSLKITVATLLGLIVLVFFGTLYQVENGLYAAQQKYFYSWFFWLFPFLPFPGAKVWLAVLTGNLLAATLTRYSFTPKKYGILLIHYGVLFLLIGSFVLHTFAKESYVSMNEGEATGSSFDYYHSEISLWQERPLSEGRLERDVTAYDADSIEVGEPIVFEEYGITLVPEYYYEHARPAPFGDDRVSGPSGLTALVYAKPPLEREQTFPGGLFALQFDPSIYGTATPQNVLLWELDPSPYIISRPDGEEIYLRLQRKRYPLPFVMRLNDFIKEEYYDTTQAKSYESQVEIIRDANIENAQENRVYMNHPLRTDNYTFFQASFAQDGQGNERSILAVVYNNTGFWIPYVASLLMVLGLLVHFIVMFSQRILQRKRS